MLYLSTSRFWWNVNSGHQRKPARLFALRTPRFARVRYADSTLGGTCSACAKDGGDQQDRHRTYPLQFHARCCSMSVAKLRVTQQIRHKNHLLSVACPTFPTTCSTTQVHYRMWIVVPKAPISISWLLVAVRPAPCLCQGEEGVKGPLETELCLYLCSVAGPTCITACHQPNSFGLGLQRLQLCRASVTIKDTRQEPELMQVLCCHTIIVAFLVGCCVELSKSGGEKMKATQSQHVTTPRVLCSGIGVDTTAKALLTC